jgi:hypothetical protein
VGGARIATNVIEARASILASQLGGVLKRGGKGREKRSELRRGEESIK